MPDQHAILGPSPAARWMTCPGSVAISEGMESRSSAHAEEGTRAHALAEAILKGLVLPAHDEEMLNHVQVYTDHVQELAASFPDNQLHVEVRVKATEDTWGTADAIVWEPHSRTLYVRDLKYGAGVAVDVSDNVQLKIYALAALLTMRLPARTVNVGIVQPRINHADGKIRSKDFDAIDLADFLFEVAEATNAVKLAGIATEQGRKDPTWIDTYLTPSEKACRWCAGAPKCPKLLAKGQELAKQAFAPGLAYDPELLAEALDFIPILEGWCKRTREFAYGEAEQGRTVPHYKLVNKESRRKWRDEQLAAHHLDALGVPCWDDPKLLSPAAVEKLMPKQQRAILADLIVKESSGVALVHESDKREAVRVGAKAAFADLSE